MAPSPEQQHDLPVGMGDARRDRVPHAGAEAAVGTGVEPAPRLIRVHQLAGVGHEVTPVADDDRVAVEHLAQLAVDAGRVDRIGVGLELGPLGRGGRPPRRATWRSTARGRPAFRRTRRSLRGWRRCRRPATAAAVTWPARPSMLSVTCTTCASPKLPNDRRKSSGVPMTATTSACFRYAARAGKGQLVIGRQATTAQPVDEGRHRSDSTAAA